VVVEATGNERRLAVIWAADVAGYSRLMAEDEEATLAMLATCREVTAGLIAEHQGRIFAIAGDGLMAEFASPVQAVRCAVAVQRAIARRNADLPEARRMLLRIGINLSDVMVRGEDLYGDGVNIAARLQALAEPGQICLSATVHEQAKDRLGFPFRSIGEHAVKNIPRPVSAWTVSWALDGPVPAEVAQGGAPPRPDKPSLAVLPFVNVSGDPGEDYFADGLTDDLITALSTYRWFFVIARNSSFAYKGRAATAPEVGRELGVRYLLEGSTRRSGGRVRTTTRLVEATSGRQLWSERYDHDLADLFAIQDEIVGRVVGAIEPEMLKVETARARGKSSQSLSAWDLIFRGMWHFHQVTAEGHRQARDLFRRAVETDSLLAEGHAWLARSNAGIILYGWSEDHAADAAEGWQAATRAVRLAATDPYAHYAVGITAVAMGQPARAHESAQRAIDLSPNFALGYLLLGLSRLSAGRARLAIETIERGLRLSPNDPQAFTWLQMLSVAHYLSDNAAEAVRWADAAVSQHPGSATGLAILACSLDALGRREEALEAARRLRGDPHARMDLFLTAFSSPVDRRRILDAVDRLLREAAESHP
jgi:adenylate cyclase